MCIDYCFTHFPNKTERITRYVNFADFTGVLKWQVICFIIFPDFLKFPQMNKLL